MKAYYNEFDKNAAAWLRELISDGLIAPGDVDERSIIDVDYKDLEGYTQHHFFAGIGGWSYALRLAQWPDNKPVWTASLPCQPFSAAGKGLGKADERHLLPHFLELVAKCKPDTIFGEQVERAIGHGWLDDLQATMEAENYAIGHCVLGAHSVSAAHIRQRLYWVADSYKQGLEGRERTECTDKLTLGENSLVDGIGTSNSTGSQHRIEAAETARHRGSVESAGDADRMGNTESIDEQRHRESDQNDESQKQIRRSGISSGLHDTESQRRYIYNSENVRPPNGKGHSLANSSDRIDEQSYVVRTPEIDWIYCRDNKYRPIESGLKPLVDGVPSGMVHSGDPRNTREARSMRLKGYGNAIVPKVAAEFISAFMDTDPLRIRGG